MPTLVLPFPAIDPVALEIGPLAIRWYALAYLAGFILGWRYCVRLARRAPLAPTAEHIDEFLTWAVVGVIIGGRLGFVLFYEPSYYLQNPLEIVKIWTGGMSFHGGLLGVAVAEVLFAWRRRIRLLSLADVIAAAAPIGLFFGRIANFINGELWGRPSELPWAMVFPHPLAGAVPRHPSQLYEAVLEGLVLFVICWLLVRRREIRLRPGVVAGVFLIGYGIGRFLVEFVRESDPGLADVLLGMTMGQALCVPMVLGGLALVVYALRRTPVDADPPAAAEAAAGRR